jgi:asparagine synthase (glutamine-hydrolysing)
MPGVVGAVDADHSPDELQSLLQRMCQTLEHEPWYRIETYGDRSVALGRVSLGAVNSDPQPVFNEKGTLCIVMEGELYETQSLKKAFITEGHRLTVGNDADLLLHLYEEYGEAFLNNLHGVFTLAIWDAQAQKLLVANDRFGLWPVYYAQHDGRLLFAPEVKGILADSSIPHVVDDTAVAHFFHFGHLLGDETFFTHIELLPPASVLVWQEGKATVKQYWDLELTDRYLDQPEADLVERLVVLTHQAVERRLCDSGDHTIGLLLSGGLDTRTLVAAIDRTRFSYPTFVFGTPHGEDVLAAQQIADLIGNPHYFVELKPDFLRQYAAQGVWLTDGMMLSNVFNVLSPLPQVRSVVKLIFTGDCGEWILGGGTPVEKELTDVSGERAMQLRYDHYYDKNLIPEEEHSAFFSTSYYRRIQGKSVESFREHYKKAQVPGSINKAVYFALRHEALRTSGYGIALLRSQLLPRIPFYDNDLLDLALQIPPELRRNRHIQIQLIKRLASDLVRVPWQYSGLPADAALYQVRIRRGLYQAHQKLRRFSHGVIPWPYHKEITPMELWLRTTLQSWVKDLLLDRRTLSRGYFNEEAVRQILDQHMTGCRDYSYRIGALITFEIWNRLFIDGDGVADYESSQRPTLGLANSSYAGQRPSSSAEPGAFLRSTGHPASGPGLVSSSRQ